MSIRIGKLGRVRLKGADLERLRRDCFIRDGYRCVVCGHTVGWVSGHMMHVKSRGAGGSDVLENVQTGCAECHMKAHNCGGRPLPRKEVYNHRDQEPEDNNGHDATENEPCNIARSIEVNRRLF